MSQYKSYPAYKDSRAEWIGEVPEHWKVVPVKYHYDARLGKMIQPAAASDSDIAVPYHRAQTVQWERVVESDVREMWASINDIEQFSVNKGDLLICEGGDVCRAAIVQESPASNMIFQNSIHRVRPKGQHGVAWILRLMQHLRSSGWVDVLCNKNTIVHFTSEKLGSLECPLPPPEEQAIIEAAIEFETTRIDTLIAKKTRFIELLKEKRQAVITKAVTKGLDDSVEMKDSGVEWLGEVPGHWTVKRLRFDTSTNPSSKELGLVLADQATTFLPMEAIGENGEIDRSRRRPFSELQSGYSYFKDGDVIIAKVTPCFENGKGAVVSKMENGFAFGTTELIVLRPSKNLLPEFLYLITRSYPVRNLGVQSMSGASGLKRVPDDFFRNLSWPIPSVSEQTTIIKYVEAQLARLDKLMEKTERSIELLKEKRSALITAAVTGKIDVREAA